MTTTPAAATPALKRSLGFWQVTVSGVGIVIGAGIYVLIGEAAKEAGAALWLSFVLAAVLSALTGLSYAELAGMFPTAGAEYEFARRAFNNFTGFMAGWTMIAANIIAAAAVSIGFARYARHFVDADERLISTGLLFALTLLVASGVQRTIWFSVSLVVLQVGGLLMIIASGAPHIGNASLVSGSSAGGVLAGAALVFFAFIGFDEVVTLSEETRDAARVIPRALLLALAIATVLYLLVGICSVSLVGADALASSDRPLALVIEHDWGSRASDIIAFIALASTTNTTLLVLTAASRLLFGMGRNGALPRVFATVGRARSPYVAAVFAFVAAAVFALAGSIGFVAAVTDFAVYAIFLTVNASVIVLRFRQPDLTRTFTVPGRIGKLPLLPIAAEGTVLLMLVYLAPSAWLVGGATLALGVLAWYVLPGRRDVNRTGR
jgi:APA family basic amino acid/polyamine antiporter